MRLEENSLETSKKKQNQSKKNNKKIGQEEEILENELFFSLFASDAFYSLVRGEESVDSCGENFVGRVIFY